MNCSSQSNDRVFCPHCGFDVAKRTYRSHRQNFYNHETKEWNNTNRFSDTSSSEDGDNTGNLHVSENSQKAPGHADKRKNISRESRKQNEYMDFFGSTVPSCDGQYKDNLLDQLCESWDSESDSGDQGDILSNETGAKSSTHDSIGKDGVSPFKVIIDWVLLFISSWVSAFNISTAAFTALLNFLWKLFFACSVLCPTLSPLKHIFPKTTYLFNKETFSPHTHFEKYVVCPTCHTLYTFGDCIKKDRSGKGLSKQCDYVRFPDHPHRKQREKCGTTLLKEVTLKGGKVKFYPRKVYSFKNVSETLSFVVQRPGFLDMCEHWRTRSCIQGVLRDVYDGRVWRRFLNFKGRPFLSEPGRLALMLNLDFFQPFKHSVYSVGVIYFAIMNLPRKERFRKENIIIAAVIPGPKEPNPHQLNCYLKPLVDDLLTLWEKGLSLTINGKETQIFAMVIAIAADVPAARKLSGFLSRCTIMNI